MFNAELADDLDVVRPAIVEGQGLPLTEAAQILNITRRSALRLIHEGKLAATKDGHGQWLVDRTSIKERLSAKSSASGNVEQVAVHVDDVQGHAWSEGQAAGQQHLLKELIDKIETLTWRNGYLEAQLSERDQQVKLLPDLQAKADASVELQSKIESLELQLQEYSSGWWSRFRKWCMGR
ncbi:MAG: helix-turn-helix domain-containing protein [Candidatus Melainabacteria bacterium]|nr:helix-turn-helix domain-containing protein [Candidatus Melainabacteria bacterium]